MREKNEQQVNYDAWRKINRNQITSQRQIAYEIGVRLGKLK